MGIKQKKKWYQKPNGDVTKKRTIDLVKKKENKKKRAKKELKKMIKRIKKSVKKWIYMIRFPDLGTLQSHCG